MDDVVEPAWSAGVLLLIAAVGVLVLLLLIMKVRLHAFLALVLVSLGVALAARIPVEEVVGVLTDGFGSTLASVALLVGLGAMLGRLLDVSGGAQVLADSLIRRFGEQRAPLALGVAALLFGFPIFFDAGLVVFLPIVFTVARRLGGSLLTYGLPVAGAFAVMHAFVPPHPGPVAAAELVGADIGLVLVFGLLIGLPTWYVGGYLFGTWAGRTYDVAVPDLLSAGGGSSAATPVPAGSGSVPAGGRRRRARRGGGRDVPRARGAVWRCAAGARPGRSPVVRHGRRPPAAAARADLPQHRHEHPRHRGRGRRGRGGRPHRPARRGDAGRLLITVLVASYVLGTRRGTDAPQVESIVNSALGPVCAIILITGAGGMFGGVLRASGIGQALADVLEPTSACRSSSPRSSSRCCCAWPRARRPSP